MIKHINITNADIVKSMSDETKHNFANHCIINKVQPEETIELVQKVTNVVVNCAIDLCNNSLKPIDFNSEYALYKSL